MPSWSEGDRAGGDDMVRAKTMAVGVVIVVVFAGCGGGRDVGETPTTGVVEQSTTVAVPTTTTSLPPIASKVVGPVFYKCIDGVELMKLDVETGYLVPFVSYPGLDCQDIPPQKLPFSTSGEFVGQEARLSFSPDYQKLAIQDNTIPSDHVGYYDRDLDKAVDVTAMITPTRGDFDSDPRHSGGWFAANDLFVFHDDDTDKPMAVDLETKSAVNVERAKVPAWVENVMGKAEDSSQYRPRTCGGGVWVIDNKRYLQLTSDAFVRMADMPDKPDDASCEARNGKDAGQRLTPVVTGYREGGFASDPTGDTVIFTFINRDQVSKIFKANFADPDHPIELPARIPPEIQNNHGLNGGIYQFEIIDWL